MQGLVLLSLIWRNTIKETLDKVPNLRIWYLETFAVLAMKLLKEFFPVVTEEVLLCAKPWLSVLAEI